MKKGLALFLCLLTLFSAFGGLTAFAEDPENPPQNPTQEQSEELPVVPQVRIVTNDNVGLSLKKADGYVDATMTVTDTNGAVIDGAGLVKIRGNSTMNLNKKSYTFKYAKKTDVLGMGKAKKWALVANMFDPTLLRNYIAVDTARELGLPYTSEKRIVEVWVDNSFRGCYLMIEPVEEGSTRVDIDIDSNDGKKDFLIEREHNHVDEGVTYFKSNNLRFACKEPEEPNDEQLAYIQSTVDDIFNVLNSGRRKEIEKKVDIDSFAKYYLLNEFVKTVDFNYSSVFFYYKGGKLYAGPAWDYDLSMGNEDVAASQNYADANNTEDLYCDAKHFYASLCKYGWFFDAVRKVYLNNREYLGRIGAEDGMADSLYTAFQSPIERNFSSTGAGWHTYAYYAGLNRRPSANYAENLSYLKNWCYERAAWLNGYFTEDVTSYIIGDADSDNILSIMDATMIQRVLASAPEEKLDRVAADADCDSGLTIFDATRIQMCLADFSSDYVGETIWIKTT